MEKSPPLSCSVTAFHSLKDFIVFEQDVTRRNRLTWLDRKTSLHFNDSRNSCLPWKAVSCTRENRSSVAFPQETHWRRKYFLFSTTGCFTDCNSSSETKTLDSMKENYCGSMISRAVLGSRITRLFPFLRETKSSHPGCQKQLAYI